MIKLHISKLQKIVLGLFFGFLLLFPTFGNYTHMYQESAWTSHTMRKGNQTKDIRFSFGESTASMAWLRIRFGYPLSATTVDIQKGPGFFLQGRIEAKYIWESLLINGVFAALVVGALFLFRKLLR